MFMYSPCTCWFKPVRHEYSYSRLILFLGGVSFFDNGATLSTHDTASRRSAAASTTYDNTATRRQRTTGIPPLSPPPQTAFFWFPIPVPTRCLGSSHDVWRPRQRGPCNIRHAPFSRNKKRKKEKKKWLQNNRTTLFSCFSTLLTKITFVLLFGGPRKKQNRAHSTNFSPNSTRTTTPPTPRPSRKTRTFQKNYDESRRAAGRGCSTQNSRQKSRGSTVAVPWQYRGMNRGGGRRDEPLLKPWAAQKDIIPTVGAYNYKRDG